MSRPRFFAIPDPDDEGRARLDREGARHLRARRCTVGSQIHAILGPGDERHATVESLDTNGAALRLGATVPTDSADPATGLTVAVALADLPRFDTVIEKATELGATRVQPFVAARSQIRTLPTRRIERWERIARSACEQCGRTTVPEIGPALSFDDVIGLMETHATTWVCRPGAGDAGSGRDGSQLVVIGPEGGLDEAENAAFTARGARELGLGPRILRFETAVLAAIVRVTAPA